MERKDENIVKVWREKMKTKREGEGWVSNIHPPN